MLGCIDLQCLIGSNLLSVTLTFYTKKLEASNRPFQGYCSTLQNQMHMQKPTLHTKLQGTKTERMKCGFPF